MKEFIVMDSPELQNDTPNYLLLDGAEGTIQQTETQETEVVDRLTDDIVKGRFLVATDKGVPCKCIDGRKCEHATEGPNAAGGTESLFVADDLTKQIPEGPLETVADGMRRVIQDLQEKHYPVGGHSDDHHEDLNDSGCGANDRLPKIYDMITRKPEVVKQYVEAILGEGTVDEETESLIVANAKHRIDARSFSSGKEVFDVLYDADDSHTEELEGSHNEVVAGINMREGTTMSREAIAEEYGEGYQAFNIDAWSFVNAARAMTENEDAVRQKVVAMTYYNVATALVLCGPKMRVAVVS